MKICFLNNTLNAKEGRGRYGSSLVNSLSGDNDFEMTVLTEDKSGHRLEKPILLKSYLLRDFFNLFINAARIRKYIKGCDIIHALDGYPYAVIAALANIGLNKRLIISGIGTYSVLPLSKKLKKILLKWAYRKAERILCISNFTKEQILKKIKLKNIKVINLGVDYKNFSAYGRSPAGRQILSKLNQKQTKIIISVGALKPRKGYHVSIPAMAEVKKKYSDIKYYIVGGKPVKIYLDLVKEYKLENNVKFFENLSDEELIKFYYKSDIFLLTPIVINNNDFEGFGLVYLEAGACGKPTIGTYDCGAEDAIINNKTGLLVPQSDVEKTAEAVLKLLDNPELAKKIGENGKKRAQEMSWDNMVNKYIKEYENITCPR